MSALRVSVPGVEIRFVDIRYGCNGRSAKTAIGGGTIVRPGPTTPHDARKAWKARNKAKLIEQQRARRAAGKR